MTVVVGFIPTPVGFAALDAALAEARRRGGPLIVVNAVRDEDADDVRHARPDQLEIARERLRGAPVRVDVRQVHAQKDAADALIAAAAEERAELVVVGIRREREVARHILGTTAHRLLIDAPCDVLVV